MDQPIVFPDPRLAVRDALRALLAARPEALAQSATVSTKGIPGADEGRPLPYIQIRSDGRYRDSRLNGRATIRVLVYHKDEGLAERLAGICEALLLAASTKDLRGASSVTGPIPTTDPDNGLPFSFITISARLRPSLLT